MARTLADGSLTGTGPWTTSLSSTALHHQNLCAKSTILSDALQHVLLTIFMQMQHNIVSFVTY